jgi:cytochrome c6
MKKLVLAVAFVLPALAVQAQENPTAQLYGSKCAVCHGKDGKGTPVGKNMGAQDLTQTKLSEADIKAVITNGRKKMQPYKEKLTAEQIDALSKFVKNGLK